ncbi:MAG: YbaB/EbfC family nucleoid-associated protein [Firmicutes bacterium]|nr:YbaB/EbfC family nucleoid-associated protein [Bacillota bacterium]
MLENLGNMGQIMSQMQKIQQEIEALNVEVSSPDGVVKVVMNGKQDLVSVSLDQEAIKNIEVAQLESSLTSALNQAKDRSRAAVKDKLSQATGLDVNGMMNMFG